MSKTSILAIVALVAGCASDGGAPAPAASEALPTAAESVAAEVPSAGVGGAPVASAVVSAAPVVSASASAAVSVEKK